MITCLCRVVYIHEYSQNFPFFSAAPKMVNYKIVARDGIPESAPWPVSEYAGF